jgi:hypothetical protein
VLPRPGGVGEHGLLEEVTWPLADERLENVSSAASLGETALIVNSGIARTLGGGVAAPAPGCETLSRELFATRPLLLTLPRRLETAEGFGKGERVLTPPSLWCAIERGLKLQEPQAGNSTTFPRLGAESARCMCKGRQ